MAGDCGDQFLDGYLRHQATSVEANANAGLIGFSVIALFVRGVGFGAGAARVASTSVTLRAPTVAIGGSGAGSTNATSWAQNVVPYWDRGIFPNRLQSLTCHFAKHGRPGQSLTSYAN